MTLHTPTTPAEVISYLLPLVATAGSYSARIQARVGVHAAKDGTNIFQHALSDADLTIQSFFEVALLAKFPHLSFFSEEQEQSLNLKYFPAGSSLEVLLDPIDGTRSYIDSKEHYQVIVTLHNHQEIVGAICYMPRRDRCYVATKGAGAFILSHDDIVRGAHGTRFQVQNNAGPILVFNNPRRLEQLSKIAPTVDIVESYKATPGKHNSTDLLEGLSQAVFSEPMQAIDGGALAFIAAEAGAIATDLHGEPLGNFRLSSKRVLAGGVVSCAREVHEAILKIIRSEHSLRK